MHDLVCIRVCGSSLDKFSAFIYYICSPPKTCKKRHADIYPYGLHRSRIPNGLASPRHFIKQCGQLAEHGSAWNCAVHPAYIYIYLFTSQDMQSFFEFPLNAFGQTAIIELASVLWGASADIYIFAERWQNMQIDNINYLSVSE